MRKTSIIRLLCIVVAALSVAVAAVDVTVRHARTRAVEEAASVTPDPGPQRTVPTPSTTAPTVVPPPTTAPPTTVSTTTTTVAPGGPARALRRGDRSAAVGDLQRRLRALGYWLGDGDGTFGLLTEQAVMAFQKVEPLEPDGVAGASTRAALAAADRPTSSVSGDLVEVDKARQVLFVVRGGKVSWTLNVSTGTEQPYEVGGRVELADTPVGRWTVGWAVDGVDVGELGALYRPRYFHRDGIAVHGSSSVPAHPASHGCVRVSEPAMDWIWADGLMPVGSSVWIH